MTQGALAALTVLATGVVYYSDALVGILGTIGWGFFAAAFVPIVALGLNWKGATTEGAVVAIVGALGVNLFYSAVPMAADIAGLSGLATAINGLYPFPAEFPVGTVSLLVSIALFVFVSIATQERSYVPADLRALIER